MNRFAPVLLPLTLLACTSDAPRTASMPQKVFDFAPRPLGAPATTLAPNASPKMRLRYALQSAMAQIAACANARQHLAGTIDLTITFVIDGERSAVDSVEAQAFGDATMSACIGDALLAIAPPDIAVDEPEVWIVHAPIEVTANYTASR